MPNYENNVNDKELMKEKTNKKWKRVTNYGDF
jgi:hypothetical protein